MKNTIYPFFILGLSLFLTSCPIGIRQYPIQMKYTPQTVDPSNDLTIECKDYDFFNYENDDTFQYLIEKLSSSVNKNQLFSNYNACIGMNQYINSKFKYSKNIPGDIWNKANGLIVKKRYSNRKWSFTIKPNATSSVMNITGYRTAEECLC